MKVIPPKDVRLQCPECGVPVEALEAHGRDGTVALDPCGHSVPATSWGHF